MGRAKIEWTQEQAEPIERKDPVKMPEEDIRRSRARVENENLQDLLLGRGEHEEG